jgi:hypothetical protein
MARPKLEPVVAVQRELERFWGKVDFEDTRHGGRRCWIWRGGSFRDGYGQFHLYERRKVQAHRYAYQLLVGPIPEGLTLDHLCRNRACVNPSHLEPVSVGENVLRGGGPSALHARAVECPHGHPYNSENTYVRYDGRRVCRICNRKWDREKMRRRRARARSL